MDLLRSLTAALIRGILWLRYDIKVTGADKLKNTEGVLILPNHPGEMDPVIVSAMLWNKLKPHPVAVEDFFYMKGVSLLMRFVGTIPMPNMEGGVGSYKRYRVRQALDRAAEHLADGENILIYPAGQMMRSGSEDLRGASGVYDLLQRMPEKKIVIVRTRGLMGSMFSWVSWQGRPPLGTCLLRGAGYLLLNLIFFAPRRKVTMEVIESPEDFPYDGDKMEINRYLENWFNDGGPEESVTVPFMFWSSKAFDLVDPEPGAVASIDVDPALRKQIVDELGKRKDRAADEIRDEWRLSSELGFDSLELAELLAWLGEEFHAFDVKPEDLKTVADVQVAAAGAANAHSDELAPAPDAWTESLPRPAIRPPDVKSTVHLNFLRLAEESPKSVAIADETSGVLTYSRMRTGVVLMADIISEYPDKHVGIMLPATAGGALLVLATLTAGKVPVMINWTVGDANFQHVVKVSGVGVILTSAKFLDKVDTLEYDNIADHIVTLEDLRQNKIRLGRKLKAVVKARKSAAAICAEFGSDKTTPEDTGVILFTSGSESTPKGVSLSHRNILSNIAASLDRVKLSSTDVLYGFLPPFHSFGFTITTILPLVSGLKTAYYPNPTEARALARGIGMWKPTVLCGTPTFLSSIFRSANDAQLKSLELLLAGAEKAPAELFSAAKKRCGAEVLEGYGITECSPVITICAAGEERVGVGPPLKGITLRAVHPETREPVGTGIQGLILVNGPSVFGGYLDRDSTDAFMELEGERYYVTGDLGIIDEKSRLTLTGRLKRFVKIGGEMISLPAMEAVIQDKIPSADEDGGVAAALTYVEEAGERAIIALFSTVEIDSETVNDYLRDAGFSNLARIRKVMMIDEIPLLGTGKTNYRALTALLKESQESSQ